MKHGKVYQIIEEEFDNRLWLTIVGLLLDYGLDIIKEGPLESLADEGTISYRAIKCANRIANECSKREILQYVVKEWGSRLERGEG